MDPNQNDGLTDSERAVLAELDAEDDDNGSDTNASDDAGEDDAGSDDEGGGGNAPGADAATGDDAGAADADAGAEDTPAEPARTAEPIYKAETPADVNAKLKEIQQARRQARKDYEEGALDEDQYDAKLDDLDQQRDKINRDITRAEVSAEMTSQQLAKSYSDTVGTFMADMKRAGIDYRDAKNAKAAKYLNARVIALAQTEHEQSPQAWRELLDEAHALTARKFGIQTKAEPKGEGKPAGKQAPPNRKPDLSGIPPTVGRGPGAANAAVTGDEFAHLESLSGIALEREVSKMTPEQLDRYLA
jgi:hypothetical protein